MHVLHPNSTITEGTEQLKRAREVMMQSERKSPEMIAEKCAMMAEDQKRLLDKVLNASSDRRQSRTLRALESALAGGQIGGAQAAVQREAMARSNSAHLYVDNENSSIA